MKRRYLLAAPALLAVPAARAQDGWPRGPVRVVITYPPGGTSDFVARVLSTQLSQQTGHNFVVENRSGGAGVVGWTHVVRAAPDGTTLLLTDNSLATAPPLMPNLGFDIMADFTPISLLVDYPCVLVVPADLPVTSLAEFVAYAKARRADDVFYGSMGPGSSPHLYAEVLQEQSGMRMTHVPYRGMGPAFTDLLAGRVALLIAAPATVMEAVKAGRVRALAIGTPAGRMPALPDVPTLKELGYDFTYSFWYGLLGPKGVPEPVVARLQAEIRKALDVPEFRERFVSQGAVPVAGDGAALHRVMKADLDTWGGVIRAKGITLQN